MSHAFAGSCHCGAIEVTLETERDIEEIAPRMCGCDFCRKHPAKWFADPAGQLNLKYGDDPVRYRFGTKTADFILCPNCGVLIAAICVIEDADYAVFNLNCLDGRREWPQPGALSDFDGEGTGDRLARRAKNWMPVTQSGAA